MVGTVRGHNLLERFIDDVTENRRQHFIFIFLRGNALVESCYDYKVVKVAVKSNYADQ